MSQIKKKTIIAGWLNKKKSNILSSLVSSWNKRYFILNNNMLSYYQNNNMNEQKFWGASDTIMVTDMKGIERDGSDMKIFKLFTTNRIYVLQAETEAEAVRWYNILKHYIEKNEDMDELTRMTKNMLLSSKNSY